MTYFFLSRAEDDDELYVERFFTDLTAEVRNRTEVVRSEDIGFLDTPPEGGPLWPIDTWQALTSCQTFVAMCSGRYFLSERCGRAWGIFADRLRRHELATGVRVPALIPVIWSHDDLPPDAFSEEGVDLTPHRTPGDEDLRVLLRLRSHRVEYRAFVTSLALRVVEIAQAYRLPPAAVGTDFDAARSAFDSHPRWVGAPTRPRTVHFVVAAGTRTQMQTVRNDVQFYGDRAEDWAPFRPAGGSPIATYAGAAAARRLLTPNIVPLDLLPECISVARRHNEIVVLLVDAWAAVADSLRSNVADLAKHDDGRMALLVTASGDDPETVARQDELRAAIADTFPDRTGRDAARIAVTSMESLDDSLGRVLAESENRLHHSGRVFRQTATPPARSRPILGGP